MGISNYRPGTYIRVDDTDRFRIEGSVCLDRFYTMKAYDEQKKEYCFLKFKETGRTAIDPDVNNLHRESRFIFHYTYIAQVYGSFWGTNPQGDPVYGVSMEYISGDTLADYRKKLELCDEETERKLLKQILQFIYAINYYLGYAEPQYYHRDLKPENIMITESEDVKLVDFDYSHISGSTDTVNVPGYGLGFSRGYSDPYVLKYDQKIREGKASEDPGERLDIYAAGMVIFYWMHGRCYFEDDERDGDLENTSTKLYWNNDKLAYQLELSRFDRKYREKRYKGLINILKRMCCAPGTPGAYRTIAEVKADMERFLLGYCGNSYENYEKYFDLTRLLRKSQNLREEKGVQVAYRYLNPVTAYQGGLLPENGMKTVIVDNRPAVILCNRNNKIILIPALGVKVERMNRQKSCTMEIESGDKIEVNQIQIEFLIN